MACVHLFILPQKAEYKGNHFVIVVFFFNFNVHKLNFKTRIIKLKIHCAKKTNPVDFSLNTFFVSVIEWSFLFTPLLYLKTICIVV